VEEPPQAPVATLLDVLAVVHLVLLFRLVSDFVCSFVLGKEKGPGGRDPRALRRSVSSYAVFRRPRAQRNPGHEWSRSLLRNDNSGLRPTTCSVVDSVSAETTQDAFASSRSFSPGTRLQNAAKLGPSRKAPLGEPAQPDSVHASQQLASVPTHADPFFGGVHLVASFFVEHLVLPFTSVRQQVTNPGLPQVERAAHDTTAPLHDLGSSPDVARAFATPRAHLTYWPWFGKPSHEQSVSIWARAAATLAASAGSSPHFA
jgi:hypothetical protein